MIVDMENIVHNEFVDILDYIEETTKWPFISENECSKIDNMFYDFVKKYSNYYVYFIDPSFRYVREEVNIKLENFEFKVRGIDNYPARVEFIIHTKKFTISGDIFFKEFSSIRDYNYGPLFFESKELLDLYSAVV